MNRMIHIFLSLLLMWGSFGHAQEKYAVGERYMVSAPTPEAVEAGLSILKQGGNAVDAAAAAAFALMVTDPAMCSLGGRSQILIWLAGGGYIGIDGATQTPLRVDEPARLGHGYRAAPIPGSPAALEEMVTLFGSLPFENVLQPAIRLAEEGFVIKKDYHETFSRTEETLMLYRGSRKHFFKPDGSPYSEGEVFRQPALAATLKIIAEEGADALYRGRLARSIVRDMERNGGLVRHDDLAKYQPMNGVVVEGEYRGFCIVARGGNCDGASVIEMLQILEHFHLKDYNP